VSRSVIPSPRNRALRAFECLHEILQFWFSTWMGTVGEISLGPQGRPAERGVARDLARREPERPRGQDHPILYRLDGDRDMNQPPQAIALDSRQVGMNDLWIGDEHIEIEVAPRPGVAPDMTTLEYHTNRTGNVPSQRIHPTRDLRLIDHPLPSRSKTLTRCAGACHPNR